MLPRQGRLSGCYALIKPAKRAKGLVIQFRDVNAADSPTLFDKAGASRGTDAVIPLPPAFTRMWNLLGS
jgi:hypothetical protein